MNAAVSIAIAFAAGCVVVNTTFLATGTSLRRFVGVVLTKAVLGVGPKIFGRTFGTAVVELRLVPLSSYVKFLGQNPAEDPPPPPPPPPDRLWLASSPLRRVLAFVLAPRLANLALPVLVLGPRRALEAVASGVPDLFAAFSGSQELLRIAKERHASEGLLVLVALTVCKMVSAGLLTLPTDLVSCTSRRHDLRVGKLAVVLMLSGIVLVVAWIVAFVRFAVAGG